MFNPTISQDTTAKMEPIILDDKVKVKQLALKEYLVDGEERTLELLCGVCKGIKRLDNKIAEMIKSSDEFREQKKLLEYKLEKLGMNCEKIKKAQEDLEEKRPYMRTSEREKADKEEDQKRKTEEEAQEIKSKKQKVVSVIGGEIVPEQKKTEEDEAKLQQSHYKKMAEQQQEILWH